MRLSPRWSRTASPRAVTRVAVGLIRERKSHRPPQAPAPGPSPDDLVDRHDPETTAEVDSTPIRDAAARAIELWPDERPHHPPRSEGGWTSYTAG